MHIFRKRLMAGLVLPLALPLSLQASDLDLSNEPLAIKTQGVNPNVVLIVDESGSMDYNDVFYAPGYDADKEYRCLGNVEIVRPVTGQTVTVYISKRSGADGVPYFYYDGSYYGWGEGGAGQTNASSVTTDACFDPDEKYRVKLRADSCSNSNYCVANGNTEDMEGNFLNWYFSATVSEWADESLTGGYTTYSGAYWSETVADNFKTSSGGDRGLKPGVSYDHKRMTVAKDVAKKLVRDTDKINLGIATYSTNSNGSSRYRTLQHGVAELDYVSLPTETNSRKLTMLDVIADMSQGGGTPTGSTLMAVAKYLFNDWDLDFQKFDFRTGDTTTELKSLDDAVGNYTLSIPGGTPGHSASQGKFITEQNWCQKNAVAVLTDGQPTVDQINTLFNGYVPLGVNRTEFNALSDNLGQDGSDSPRHRKNLIKIAGALFDHDFFPSIRGKQNIESFFIAFGEPSILELPEFIMAGRAGGGGADNFYAARDGGQISQAFKDIVSRVQADSASVTAIAVSAVSELRADNYAIQATYDTEYWNSELKGLRVNEDGQFTNPDGTGASDSSADIIPVWEASDVMHRMYLMANHSDYIGVKKRRIYTWTGSQGMRFGSDSMTRPASSSTSFAEFDNLPLAIRNDISMRAGNNWQERYDLMMFLMGDASNEVAYPSAAPAEKYRRRGIFLDSDNDNAIDTVLSGGLLGDITHSSPMYVREPPRPWNDIHFGKPGQRYSDFRNQLADRQAMVYVGANDGMLHAFTVEAGSRDGINYPAGGELFAYIPSMLASTASKSGLRYLANRNYEHRYYVDLTPTVSDVFMDFYSTSAPMAPEWRTILVGGLRGGGKGLFALDITCPYQTTATGNTCDDEQFTEQNVLWEFSGADDPDLGLTFAEPIIAKVNFSAGLSEADERNGNGTGRWAVIVSNGYNSASGRAALFILFLDGGLDGSWVNGRDYLKLFAGNATDDTPTDKNGLSSPTAIDITGDGLIDRVYAGDLKGQMWVFDLNRSLSLEEI